MKTIEVKLYSYDELSEEARENVRQLLYDINIDSSFWYEYLLSELHEECGKLGIHFKVDDLEFDLFSRRANLSVTSSCLTFDWENEVLLTSKFGAYRNYLGGGMQSASKCSAFAEGSIIGRGTRQFPVKKIVNNLNEAAELFQKTFDSLYKEYRDQTSGEAIEETIRANEYEFTESGAWPVF